MGTVNVQVLAHTVVAVALIAAYAVLTALNHDANTLLGILAGQGVGAAISGIGATTAAPAAPVTAQAAPTSPAPPPVPTVTGE